jgi:hypothetical protein
MRYAWTIRFFFPLEAKENLPWYVWATGQSSSAHLTKMFKNKKSHDFNILNEWKVEEFEVLPATVSSILGAALEEFLSSQCYSP